MTVTIAPQSKKKIRTELTPLVDELVDIQADIFDRRDRFAEPLTELTADRNRALGRLLDRLAELELIDWDTDAGSTSVLFSIIEELGA